MSVPGAIDYARAGQRKLKDRLSKLVQRGVVTSAGDGLHLGVSTYDGNDMGTIARLRGAEINVGDTVYTLNTTPGSDAPGGLLILGAEGGLAASHVYRNTFGDGSEPSTTNSATPVAAYTATWALPAGTYTVVVDCSCGLRNNVDGGYQGHLEVQIDGTVVDFTDVPIPTSSGVQPIVRAPVTVGGSLGGRSGTVTLSLLFRNTTGTGVTIWCFCPRLNATAQRTA